MVYTLSVIGVVAFVVSFLFGARVLLSRLTSLRGDFRLLAISWFLMYFGMGLFFQREGLITGVAGIDKSAMFQMSCVAIAVVCLMLIQRSGSAKFLSNTPVIGLGLYGFIAVLSMSVSPAPTITLYKALLLFVDVLLVIITLNVMSRTRPRLPLEICYFISYMFCVGALVGVVYDPVTALKPTGGAVGVLLRGSFPVMNSNELGFLGGVTAVIGIIRMHTASALNMRLVWVSFAVVGIVVLGLAQARTSLAAVLIALVFLSFSIRSMRWLKYFVATVFIVSVVYSVVSGGVAQWQEKFFDATVEYAERGQDDHGLQTLKGRAEAWLGVGMQMLSDSPAIGHGFDAGVRYDTKYGMGGSHMHNSHFQILANTGVLGYLAWLVMFIPICLKVYGRYREEKRLHVCDLVIIEIIAIFILIILRSVTGQVLVTHQWSLLLFLGGYIYAVIAAPDTGERGEKEQSFSRADEAKIRRYIPRSNQAVINKR